VKTIVQTENPSAMNAPVNAVPARAFTVRVPASSSNLGAGFDCFGLALQLYLTVRGEVAPAGSEPCQVESRGEGMTNRASLSSSDNLIFRAMRLAAEREGLSLPPVCLSVDNELPLGRGLGSSAAAIIAGITLVSLLCNRELAPDTVLRYALELEGHADNIAACYHGGWVVTCVKSDGGILAIKKPWPADLKVIVISPDAPLKTADTRSALPATVGLADAVYNLQRVALFDAAIESGNYGLLWEAMQDRLHQTHRQSLVPGLREALETPRLPGLAGLALSGSGPSVIALASARSEEIGETIAGNFRRHGMPATVRLLEVDREGRTATATNRDSSPTVTEGSFGLTP
jgi:homoserine kinase